MKTIFKNGSFEKRLLEKNQEFGYIATRDIKSGTLLMAEHILVSNSHETILIYLDHNRSVADLLYPRITSSIKNLDIAYTTRKVFDNIFTLNTGNLGLGIDLSFFNHSCDNNAGVSFECDNKKFGNNFAYVYALKVN
jgi:hypothetical protein